MPLMLTYDVDSKHTQIKNTLISPAYGYKKALDGVAVDDKTQKVSISLPNTTVYHATKGVVAAAADIVAVVAACGAVLEKYATIEVAANAPWRASDFT